jgi:hypothetical protein
MPAHRRPDLVLEVLPRENGKSDHESKVAMTP